MDAEWTRSDAPRAVESMLTIGKLGAGRGQLEYYEAQVAAGAEDYYSGRGESPGRWRGRGGDLLGLRTGRRAERVGFMRLVRGRHPMTGEVLRQMGNRSTVAALDLTFSAPKSVSVLFAVADGQTAAALLAAHEQAVDAALAYLEPDACWTRHGRDGLERVRGDGFIAVGYRHRMSRAADPQLHTHVVVGNLTRAGGRYTALDARALYEHKSAGGAVYRAVLRAQVRARLPWVSWRRAGRGLFEIDGIPEEVLRHFSQRRLEIEERALELTGGASGRVSTERMQAIALATRRAKRDGVDGSTWRDQARARAAEHGLGATELLQLRARPAAVPEPAAANLTASLSGPSGLTSAHNTFARRHALAEIAGEHVQGALLDAIEAAVDRYLAHSSVLPLRPLNGEARYTTAGLLACEQTIVSGFLRRRGEGTAVLPAALVAATLTSWRPALASEQLSAAGAVISSGHGVDVITAVAGSGKTTAMGALAACYRQAEWSVIGAAPTARAARQLRETAAIPAETLHRLLLRLESRGGLGPDTVVVLDEAGMAPTRLTARLCELAEEAGAKVIAVGDPGQLTSVEAGGWLAAITQLAEVPRLGTALRQRDASERDALQALHDGDVNTYVDHKLPVIQVHNDITSSVHATVNAWLKARARYGYTQAVIIARDNATREVVNRAARAALKAAGELPAAGFIVGGREFTPGDRIIARRNDRRLDIDNGTLGTVTRVDAIEGAIWLRTDAGAERHLDAAYAAAYVEYAYALTAHAAQGATVEWAAVIGHPGEFTREWAYTALSRARGQTLIHLTSGSRSHGDMDRQDFAPASAAPATTDAVAMLRRAMCRTETEPIALACTAAITVTGSGESPPPRGADEQQVPVDAADRGPPRGGAPRRSVPALPAANAAQGSQPAPAPRRASARTLGHAVGADVYRASRHRPTREECRAWRDPAVMRWFGAARRCR